MKYNNLECAFHFLKVRNKTLPAVSSEAISILNSILAASQEYMRKQEVFSINNRNNYT